MTTRKAVTIMTEIFTDPAGKRWKIITLPDKTGGETAMAIEITEPKPVTTQRH